MAGKPRLLVGTKKGAFIYTADKDRKNWEVSKPIFSGWQVLHMAADNRKDPVRVYAAANHWAWGKSVARSDDGGQTWEQRSETLAFPKDMDLAIDNTWTITPGHPGEPGVVYVGTQPAGLFKSEDWGDTWKPVETLNRLRRLNRDRSSRPEPRVRSRRLRRHLCDERRRPDLEALLPSSHRHES
jgi:hypothetical protein